MKRNKILATVMALGLVLAIPQSTMVTHAEGIGFNGDAIGHTDNGTTDNGIPEPTSPSSGAYESSSSSSSSSSSESYSSGGGGESYSSGDSGSSGSSGGGSTVATPKKNANDITVGTTGGQKFRIVMNGEHTSYQVYHCGNSKVTLNVTNGNTNVVAYKTVTLEQGEDKLWYVNITFDESLDTTNYVVNVIKGELSYLKTELSVSGIKINGTLALSTTQAEAVIGHRTCVCGASFDILENSGLDEDAWNAHAKEHADKGEAVRWTDK